MIHCFTRRFTLIFGIAVLTSMPARAATLQLFDSSFSEFIAYFSTLTGNTYIQEYNTDKRFSLSRDDLSSEQQIHELLTELVEDSGGYVLQLSDTTYKIIEKQSQPDQSETDSGNPKIVKKIDLNGSLSILGLRNLIKSDERIDTLQIIEELPRGVIVFGDAGKIERLSGLISTLPSMRTPKEAVMPKVELKVTTEKAVADDDTVVIDLNYADTSEIVTNLQSIFSGEEFKLKVASHASANQVIVSGEQTSVQNAIQIIKRLDRAPRQVYVDAIIAEVSDETAAKLGLQFSVNNNNISASLVTGVPGVNIGAAAGDAFLAGATGGIIAVGRGANNVPDIGVMLSALEGNTDNRILATPSLMAVENKESIILVGQNVPFITGQYTNQNGDASTPFQTIKREDLGTLLKLKPKIGANGNIVMEIWQEVSRIDQSAPGLSDVVTVKRQISTVVSAKEGETVAIGGLKIEQQELGVTKVPVLGDLPIFGNLFRQESTNKVSRNLAIFLRPTLVSDRNDRTKIYNIWKKSLGTKLSSDPDNISNYFELGIHRNDLNTRNIDARNELINNE